MATGPLLWIISTMAEEWDAGRDVSEGSGWERQRERPGG